MNDDAIIRLILLIVLIVGFQIMVSRISLEREAKRRWQHALTGHILVQASYIIPMSLGIIGLIIGAIGMAYVRFQHPQEFLRVFGPLLRPNEKEEGKLPGAFYFLIGTALTSALFDLTTARFAVECLALADPMAALVGKSIPSSPKVNSNASFAGCFACFITSWICGYLMLPVVEVNNGNGDSTTTTTTTAPTTTIMMIHISISALACTIAECVPYGNDNLTIPLATATAFELSKKLVSLS